MTIRVSEEYADKLGTLKSEGFQQLFYQCVEKIEQYMESKEDCEMLTHVIESSFEIVQKGNMIYPHELYTLSEYNNLDEVVKFVVEDIASEYMFNDDIMDVNLIILCIHFEGLSIPDSTLEALKNVIMINYIDELKPIPEIIVCHKKQDEMLENGYCIYWFK